MYEDPIDSESCTSNPPISRPYATRTTAQKEETALAAIRRKSYYAKRFISTSNFRKYELERWNRLQNPERNYLSWEEIDRKQKVSNWAKACCEARPDLAYKFQLENGEFKFPMPLPGTVDLSPTTSYLEDTYSDWEERHRLIRDPSDDDYDKSFWYNCLDPTMKMFFTGLFYGLKIQQNVSETLQSYHKAHETYDSETQTPNARLYKRDFLSSAERDDHDFKIQISNQLRRLENRFNNQNHTSQNRSFRRNDRYFN